MAASLRSEVPFPAAQHDHRRCIHAILDNAEAVCDAHGARLTDQRRRVLRIVADSHGAVGAYDILERLVEDGKRPAPVTVYRALDFLMEHGLVHRLASLNAYMACLHPGAAHGAQFLICQRCGMIGELADAGVGRAVAAAAAHVGFSVTVPVVEVAGLCARCRQESRADART